LSITRGDYRFISPSAASHRPPDGQRTTLSLDVLLS
jgi:hypothetical protein